MIVTALNAESRQRKRSELRTPHCSMVVLTPTTTCLHNVVQYSPAGRVVHRCCRRYLPPNGMHTSAVAGSLACMLKKCLLARHVPLQYRTSRVAACKSSAKGWAKRYCEAVYLYGVTLRSSRASYNHRTPPHGITVARSTWLFAKKECASERASQRRVRKRKL